MRKMKTRNGLFIAGGLVFLVMVAASAQRMIESLDIGGGYGATGISLESDGDTLANGNHTIDGDLVLKEKADHSSTPAAGYGYIWVKNDAPTVVKYTDDTGVDITLGTGSGSVSSVNGYTGTVVLDPDDLDDTSSTAKWNQSHTGDVTGATALAIANGAVDIAHHSATGTADATTFYRGDNVWATPAGGGDMTLAGSGQNVTGDIAFDDGGLIINGATSGSTTIKAAAVAGTTIATFQGSTGTVAWSADIPANTDSLAEGSTNRYVTTADETTLGYITITAAANIDSMITDIAANTAKTGNATHTGDVTGATALAIANGAVDIAHHSATGTADATTFYRGDNVWATPASDRSGEALTDAATVAVDSDYNFGTVTLAGNRTLGSPSGTPVDGQLYELIAIQDGTGSRTLAYHADYEFSTGLVEPTLTTTAGAEDVLLFRYSSSAAKWRLYAIVQGF